MDKQQLSTLPLMPIASCSANAKSQLHRQKIVRVIQTMTLVYVKVICSTGENSMLLFVKQIHRTIIVQTFHEHHVFTLQQGFCLYKLVVKFFLQASSGFLFIANSIEKKMRCLDPDRHTALWARARLWRRKKREMHILNWNEKMPIFLSFNVFLSLNSLN